MRSLLRTAVALSVIFVLLAAAFPLIYHYMYSDPPQLQENTEFRKGVNAISDIEHLRKVLFTVVTGTDKLVLESKKFLDQHVTGISSLLLLAACGFAYIAVLAYRLERRKGDGT